MKKIKLLAVMILTGVVLTGCGNSSKLGEAYDEEALKTDALGVINMMCDGDYDGVISKMTEEVAKAISADALKEGWEPMKEKLGDFKSVDKETVVDSEGLATVVIIAEFENGKSQFTITYNEDMKLEGLYMK